MPRAILTTADDAGKRHKFIYKGKQYTMAYAKLGGSSASATQTAANQWVIAKKAEIDGAANLQQAEFFAMMRATMQQGQLNGLLAAAHQLFDDEMRVNAGGEKPLLILQQHNATAREIQAAPIDIPQDRTIGFHFQAWKKLEMSRGVVRAPGNVRCVEIFIEWINQETAVESIDETTVEEYYLFLKASPDYDENYKFKIWQLFKRFIGELAEKRILQAPLNLKSRTKTFEVEYDAPTFWTLPDLHTMVANGDELQRLWALLMLNCGWRQSDIASLKDTDVNWTNGIITRQRRKLVKAANGKQKKIPVVKFFLWEEVFALLKKFRSGNKLVFADRNARDEKDEKELIKSLTLKIGHQLNTRRLNLGIQEEVMKLRSTAANILETHAEYGRYVPYFLGEKPSGTAAKHYVEPSDEQFGNALTWIHEKLGLITI